MPGQKEGKYSSAVKNINEPASQLEKFAKKVFDKFF